jgi:hypothetical protein
MACPFFVFDADDGGTIQKRSGGSFRRAVDPASEDMGMPGDPPPLQSICPPQLMPKDPGALRLFGPRAAGEEKILTFKRMKDYTFKQKRCHFGK